MKICISLAFSKYHEGYNILKITLVQAFCAVKFEITQLPIGFRLNIYNISSY